MREDVYCPLDSMAGDAKYIEFVPYVDTDEPAGWIGLHHINVQPRTSVNVANSGGTAHGHDELCVPQEITP